MHATRDQIRIALLFFFLIIVVTSDAQLSLPAIFSDNLILQRSRTVPVWGKANPGETVTVSFGSQTKNIVDDGWFNIAREDGILLPPETVIKGKWIIVSSVQVENPKYVRFAWNETAQPNFINKEGLPAEPFRTDHLKTD